MKKHTDIMMATPTEINYQHASNKKYTIVITS